MKRYAGKKQGNNSQSVANNLSEQQSGDTPAFQFKDNRPGAIAQKKLQDTISNSPRIDQLKATSYFEPLPIQRKLGGSLEKITESYLSKFAEEFEELRQFKNRRSVLRALQSLPGTLSTDDDLRSALPGVIAELGVSGPSAAPLELMPALGASAAASSLPVEERIESDAVRDRAPSFPASLAGPSVISVSPSEILPSRRLAPEGEAAEPSHASDRVMNLYEQGLLLVTAVQRKDLHKMHTASKTEEVSAHAAHARINMSDTDANAGQPLEYAKVNWTLTSPRMRPHYFKMIVDNENREPKPEPDIESPIVAPRIATLADPIAMGSRFMKGKTGTDDLIDWEQDQSSSKAAGVRNGEPLFSYEDAVVRDRLANITKEQEKGYLETNPEINTFGFPPGAVVGFLVTSAHERNMDALQKTKLAMSAEEQKRSFPIFTWMRTSERAWNLVLIGHV